MAAPIGLDVRLSSGAEVRTDFEKRREAVTTPLDSAATAKLLARVTPLPADSAALQGFAFRADSPPPPGAGITVVDAFPRTAGALPPPVTTGALIVERYAPEGNVPIAPWVSVTFSEPMVALGSHAESIRNGVPVEISPLPHGRWRWLGTRTVIFAPKGRMPMATRYVVQIKADAKSVSGQQLSQPLAFTFTTPAPQVIAKHPESDTQPLDPVIFIEFDQRIDAEHAAASVVLTAGERSFPLRPATSEEVAADARVATLVKDAEVSRHGGRYLTLVPKASLPKGTEFRVTVKMGMTSAEGPLTTECDQAFSFRTFEPLTIVEASCGHRGACPAGASWIIWFNNPIDEDAFDPASIRIEPAIPGVEISVFGRHLSVRGNSLGQTRYRLTLPATLRDSFGQMLGKEESGTFNVGDAEPGLFGLGSGLVILDPTVSECACSVFSINVPELVVRIRRVTPDDWEAYLEGRTNVDRQLPGVLVFDRVVAVCGPASRVSETAIDLRPALNGAGFGHAIVTVEPMRSSLKVRPRTTTWVQVTAIGLDGFVDRDEFLAWTTNLADGAPLAAVDLELLPHRAHQLTDATGLARLPLTAAFVKRVPHMLIARRGNDLAFLPENLDFPIRASERANGRWFRENSSAKLVWFVYDDRQMYRPGETVNVKGWLRVDEPGKGGDIRGMHGLVPSVAWVAKDFEDNELAKGEAPVNPFGGFHASFKLPDTPNLGWASVLLSAPNPAGFSHAAHDHSFRIEEFRRPEFEVRTGASGAPYVVGSSADVTVKAAYFAGGALPAALVKWRVTTREAEFVPPNRCDYTFGTWRPWWEFAPTEHDTKEQELPAETGPDGTHTLHLEFVSAKPARAMSLTATASVSDVNRQTWSAGECLLVHPADVYVGLKCERYFVEKGSPMKLGVLVVDHQGKAVPGRAVVLQAFRKQQECKNGRWVETRVDLEECRVLSSTVEQHCEFATAAGGVYEVEATVTDSNHRSSHTTLQVWVTGGTLLSQSNVRKESVTLIPEKQDYSIGDSARLLVQAPFFPAEGLLTVRRSGVVSTQRFHVDSGSTVLDIPIHDTYVPNVWVQVDLVGSAPRTDDNGKPLAGASRRPAFAAGKLRLAVPPRDRVLVLEVFASEKEVTPGATTTVRVQVVDAVGQAQPNVEVALMVVDEAVLALAGYKTPDPLAAIYIDRGADTQDLHTREWLALPRPVAEALILTDREDMTSGLMADEMDEISLDAMTATGAPIIVRNNFSAVAAFAPEQRTDTNGVATLAFKVPDNLTRYRIMAVAADQEHSFGSGEASVTARLPLMVRPSLPRFLNYGDRFDLPVVLQNQTDQPMTVELAVRATNATLLGPAGERVTVPASDRVEVRFSVGTEMPGTARFQMVAATAGFSDAAEISVPVRVPATTEAFAAYGEIDDGAIQQQILVPTGVLPTYGGLQLTTSSTQVAALTDAFRYLQNYPYECAEQVSSRVLAMAALRDVLDQFQASGLASQVENDQAVARGLARLQELQNWDGGFAFWSASNRSWPYISIHAAHALARAKEKGYAVPAQMLKRSKEYLEGIWKHLPKSYPAEIKRTLIAYSLWVRKLFGAPDPAKARQLLATAGVDELSMEAQGWLLGALAEDSDSQAEVADILVRLSNRVVETAAAAQWVDAYADGGYLLLHSSRRADAVILESLMLARPDDGLIPKIVRGLLAHRQRGRWANTQENVFVLLAMDAYFARYEKATPNMIARAWLGDQLADEAHFAGREATRHAVEVPMMQLSAAGTEQALIVGKTGAGRLYYRAGLTYATRDLALNAADQGFGVERRYEAIDDPAAVIRCDDGGWRIKAGALVRVRVSMVATSCRYHVALIDPLPAGFEALTPGLSATEPVRGGLQAEHNFDDSLNLDLDALLNGVDPRADAALGPSSSYFSQWYDHQNLRDDRAEAFASLLWEGVHEYTYVARATTPGIFVVPPAKAEEMYAPETFGRSASDRVVIE